LNELIFRKASLFLALEKEQQVTGREEKRSNPFATWDVRKKKGKKLLPLLLSLRSFKTQAGAFLHSFSNTQSLRSKAFLQSTSRNSRKSEPLSFECERERESAREKAFN